MHKSSLLEIIRTFTPKELIKFEDFVSSPYFNKNKNVFCLFAEVKKYAPKFTDENLEKEKVWKKLFPQKVYNYGIMKNLIHDLGKLCESFLNEEIYKTQDFEKMQNLFISLFSRNINNIFENKMAAAERIFRDNFDKNNYIFIADFYKSRKDLLELNENFIHQNNPKVKKQSGIQSFSGYMIYGFLIDCFRTFQKTVVNSNSSNHPLEKNFLTSFLRQMDEHKIIESVLKESEKTSVKDHVILKCYYSMYKALILNDNMDAYYEFKNNFSEYSGHFSDDELKLMCVFLQTCLTNLKVSVKDFYKEYFEAIQLGYKGKPMLNEDGSISAQVYFSLVNVSCGANETDYTLNFINKYTDKLPEELRECFYNYSMAQLNFTKCNFEKALEFIVKIQKEPLYLKFSIKNLQHSIYYELNDRESFDYTFDSFKHFIKKNKLTSESRVIVLTKYCGYLKSMFKLKEKYDSFVFDILKKEIEETKVGNKAWLFRKLEEIKAQHK
ncbi:MAG TPA: hypothetical protein PKA90_15195 [Ignavibacteria bacterium]|nr:hypothetical protein [Ignavibacteria bacterium]HMR41764.1 hypothetical protein [Ignavibacteria bacterium]